MLGIGHFYFALTVPLKLQALWDQSYLKGLMVPAADMLKCQQDTSGIALNPRYIDATCSYRYARVKKPEAGYAEIPIAWDKTFNHGKDTVNVLFYDLHVSFKPLPELRAMVEKNRALYDKPPVMPQEP